MLCSLAVRCFCPVAHDSLALEEIPDVIRFSVPRCPQYNQSILAELYGTHLTVDTEPLHTLFRPIRTAEECLFDWNSLVLLP